MMDDLQITGGAGPEEAAAIASVVASIEQQERDATAVRPKPIRQSQWVRAGRPLERQAPMTSAEYDRLPGGDVDDSDTPGPL